LTFDVAHAVLFIVLGALIGATGALFGIGGGLISIPLLSIVFGLDQQHAQGTTLVMGLPNIVMGVWRYAQHPNFDKRSTVVLALAAIPFNFAGAYVAVHYAGKNLRPAFGVFLIALAVWIVVGALRRAPLEVKHVERKPGLIALVGAAGGGLSGVFSSGGAAFSVPILSLVFGYTQASAQGMALGLVGPSTLVSLITYASAGACVWSIGIPLALGGSLFIKQGVALAHRLPEKTLRLFFAAILLFSALALFRPA
jgi:uncharacterized membrane protein YfcA